MDRHPEDDATLVRRCLAGDEEAWRALVETYRRSMIALARRILQVQDAEDVVDAVLVDLWERGKFAGYEGRSSLKTWLGAVVLNRALNARRAAASRAAAFPSAAQPPADPPADELRTVLHDAVASLDPATRALVLLYYERDLSLADIGRLFGQSASTLSRALKHARDDIRARADRLARERWGTSLMALRSGADLDQLDLDLRAACGEAGNNPERNVSNVRRSS